MNDLISRQAAIDELNDGAELLRRVLDDTDLVGAERAKYEWGLGLIESYISDVEELPSAETEIIRCKDCKNKDVLPDVYGIGTEALYCPAIKHYVVHDFFCKYGEKVTE